MKNMKSQKKLAQIYELELQTVLGVLEKAGKPLLSIDGNLQGIAKLKASSNTMSSLLRDNVLAYGVEVRLFKENGVDITMSRPQPNQDGYSSFTFKERAKKLIGMLDFLDVNQSTEVDFINFAKAMYGYAQEITPVDYSKFAEPEDDTEIGTITSGAPDIIYL